MTGKKEVGIVMRAIGQEPTEEEITNLVKEVDRAETGRLSFNDFLALLAHICEVGSFYCALCFDL